MHGAHGQPDDWHVAAAVPALAGSEVHVWLAATDLDTTSVMALWPLLSVEEQHKAQRFRSEDLRAKYIGARGQLRILLGRYLGMRPEKVVITCNQYGKPQLAGDAAEALHFNVSHSGTLALYALRADSDIGVDIEYIDRAVPYESIANQFFAPQEYAMVRAFPADQQQRAFFNCWVRKEACVKAVGKGLHIDLEDFTVSLMPEQADRLLHMKEGAFGADDVFALERWRIATLPAPPGYAAALATHGEYTQLCCWRYPVDWNIQDGHAVMDAQTHVTPETCENGKP